MGLFDRVFRGSDEMFAKAEAEINAVVAELGESAPMKMPDTAYYLSCIYAYLGKKVTTWHACARHPGRREGHDDPRVRPLISSPPALAPPSPPR